MVCRVKRRYHRSTSPTTHDASHEAALHDPIRQQNSADRHDLPLECPGEADNETGTWCGIYHANTMYIQHLLMKLSTLIKRVHCEVMFTTLVEMTSLGVNGPFSIHAVDFIRNASTCEHTATTSRPRSSWCVLSFVGQRAEAREFIHESKSMSTRALSTHQTGGTPQPERTECTALLVVGTYSATYVVEMDVCTQTGPIVPAKARDVESTEAQRRRRRQPQQPQPEPQQPQVQQPQQQRTQPQHKQQPHKPQEQQHHKQQHPKQQPYKPQQ